MWTSAFWMATAERAVKTAAQVLLVYLGADAVDAFAVSWERAGSIAAGAAVLSVLTSIASAQAGPDKGSPSLVGEGDGGAVRRM
jgi:hypothetical protein